MARKAHKVYPSKRIKNPFAKKFRKYFGLKGRVTLKLADKITLDGENCYGLYYADTVDKYVHIIVLSVKMCKKDTDFIASLMHEYVHAWQEENEYSTGHNEKSMFKHWQRVIYEEFGIWI